MPPSELLAFIETPSCVLLSQYTLQTTWMWYRSRQALIAGGMIFMVFGVLAIFDDPTAVWA